jgi:hypothetical protein
VVDAWDAVIDLECDYRQSQVAIQISVRYLMRKKDLLA